MKLTKPPKPTKPTNPFTEEEEEVIITAAAVPSCVQMGFWVLARILAAANPKLQSMNFQGICIAQWRRLISRLLKSANASPCAPSAKPGENQNPRQIFNRAHTHNRKNKCRGCTHARTHREEDWDPWEGSSVACSNGSADKKHSRVFRSSRP